MKKIFTPLIFTTLLMIAGSMPVLRAADTLKVTIGVTADSLTIFKGIGYNITADLSMAGYKAIKDDPAKRHQFFEDFIGGAQFKNLVLWGSKWWYDYQTDVLNQDYITYMKDAVEYGGIKHLMMNPTDKYGVHEVTPFYEQLNYQTGLVQKLHDAGVDIYGMTYKNKPNTNESGTLRQSPDSVAMGIAIQRHMLDSMGFEDILLSGPTTVEWHPRNPNRDQSHGDNYDYQDGDTEMYLNAILDNQDALNALDAFDKQSYGDGMTTWYMNKAREYNKDLWVMLSITETMNADDFDPSIPPIMTATLLGDLNHGVSIWNTWLSYRLLKADLTFKPLYFFLKNISTHFNYGATTKQCVSEPGFPTTDMHWNYYNHEDPSNYLQPKISAAACKNPDGTWSIGLVNTTGIHAQHQIANTIPVDPLEFRVFFVDLQVDELKDTLNTWFSVYRSYPDRVEKTGNVRMKNGRLDLSVLPNEALVLVSDSMTNYNPTGVYPVKVPEGFDPELISYPNPFRDRTTISWRLPVPATVDISIYDMSGRQVSTLAGGPKQAGLYSVEWNGRDTSGGQAKPGIYICRFNVRYQGTEKVKYIKMVMTP